MPSNGDNRYLTFKTDLIMSARNLGSSEIQSLIQDFEEVINSKRRSSCIRDVNDLISVLEKRAHISSDNIYPLKKIVDRLPNQEEKQRMLTRLNARHGTNVFISPSSHYAATQPQPCARIDPAEYSSQRNRQEMNYNSPTLPIAVVEHISEEIGNKWRDLARKLKLKEGDINHINVECQNDPKLCAYQCLILYQSRSEYNELEKNLLSALGKVRRNDLRNQVQTLFNRQ